MICKGHECLNLLHFALREFGFIKPLWFSLGMDQIKE